MKADRSVVLFHSTNAALRTEKLAADAGIRVKLIPVPRQMGSDCGVCIAFDPADRARVEELLHYNAVPFERISSL